MMSLGPINQDYCSKRQALDGNIAHEKSQIGFLIRCYKNRLTPMLHFAHFDDIADLKELRRKVYSQLTNEDQKLQAFELCQDEIKLIRNFRNVDKMLAKASTRDWKINLKISNERTFIQLISFLDLDYTIEGEFSKSFAKFVANPNLSKICYLGATKAAEILLQKDPSLVNDTVNQGNSTLDSALISGQLDLIKMVWEKGGRFNNYQALSSLKFGYIDVFKYLMQFDELTLDLDYPAMMYAAVLGDQSVLQILLDKGFTIDQVNSHEETALHIASRNGNVDTVAFLLDHGASLSLKNNEKKTPLALALEEGHTQVIQLLANKRKEELIKDPHYAEALFFTAKTGNVTLFESLLHDGVDRNLRSTRKESLYHTAVQYGHVNFIQKLKEKGFDFKHSSEEIASPFHCACLAGNITLIDLFLAWGEDINNTDQNGDTAIFHTAFGEHLIALRHLLSKNPDCSYKNLLQNDLLSAALLHKVPLTIIQELMDHVSFSNNHTKRDKLTHAATHPESSTLFPMILQKSAPLPAKSEDAKRALYELLVKEDFINAELLLKAGVKANFVENNQTLSMVVINSSKSNTEKITLLDQLYDTGEEFNIQTLYSAGLSNNLEIMQYLVGKLKDPTIDHVAAAFLGTIHKGNLELIKYVLTLAPLDKINTHLGSQPHTHLLLLLNTNEDVGVYLIDQGLDLNKIAVEETGLSYINFSAVNNQSLLMDKLLEKKVAIETISRDGQTLLCYLCKDYTTNGLVSNDKEINSVLTPNKQLANRKQLIEKALTAGANVNHQTLNGKTPLYFALISGLSIDIVDLLISKGADPSLIEDKTDNLFAAVLKLGRKDLYNRLIELGFICNLTLVEKLSCLSDAQDSSIADCLPQIFEGPLDFSTLPAKNLTCLMPTNQELLNAYHPYDKGFFQTLNVLKRLGHTFAISATTTLAGKRITLEGAVGLQYMQNLIDHFLKFVQTDNGMTQTRLSSQSIQTLKNSLERMTSINFTDEVDELLKNGQVITAGTGFTKHAMGMVLFKHPQTGKTHLIVSNRGVGADFAGLTEHTFTPTLSLNNPVKKVIKQNDIVYNLDEQSVVDIDQIADFWNAWSAAGVERDRGQKLFEQYGQQENTCAHDNIKGAFFGLLYAVCILEGKTKEEALQIAHELYKAFTSFDRNEVLKKTLDHFNPKTYPEDLEFDNTLFENLYQKVMSDKRISKENIEKLTETIQGHAMIR